MLKKIFVIAFSFVVFFSFASDSYAKNTYQQPAVAVKDKTTNKTKEGSVDAKSTDEASIDTGTTNSNFYDGSGNPIKLINPLGDDDITLPDLIERILSIALRIGTPLVALAIIYTGYLFIAAQGKPEKLKTAKDTLMYVLIGAAILLGAYAIAKALVSTINAIRG